MRKTVDQTTVERALEEAVEAFLRATRRLDGEELAAAVRGELAALLTSPTATRRAPVPAEGRAESSRSQEVAARELRLGREWDAIVGCKR